MAPQQRLYLIGNAHIDPVWMWRWPEGYAEVKATFRSALDRLAEFDDFVFTCACAAFYQWVERQDPAMFEDIRRRVAEGRWQVVGGMWIQPDCNLPSGESLARQLLYSQRYFAEKFGRRCTVGYNVDSFGHAGTLPMLLRAAGMDSYVMQRPDSKENPGIPGFLFHWQAPDGSRVLTYRLIDAYNTNEGDRALPAEDNPDVKKLRAAQARAEAAGLPVMHFYGVGNHGGGPTIATLQTYGELRAAPGGDSLAFSGPRSYFDAVAGRDLPVWRADLQHHASLCYSAHSGVKAGNRRAENRLAAAETYGVMAAARTGHRPDTAALDKAWQAVLFNQFHDVLDGCCIEEAYADAAQNHGLALQLAAEQANAAVQRISWAVDTAAGGRGPRSKEADWSLWEYPHRGAPVVVFNPLAWPRDIPVQLGRPVAGVTDEAGAPVPVQRVRAARTNGEDKWDALFTATVPAMGWRTYWAYLQDEKPALAPPLAAGDNFIENEHLRLEVDPATGYVTGLLMKQEGRQMLAGPAALPLVIDVEHADTWGHGLFAFRKEAGRFAGAEVQLLEGGPVRARLRVTSRHGASVLRQDFTLTAGARRVEVEVRLDWRERFKLLKLSFPLAARGVAATYHQPFGAATKPPNGEEEPGQMWFDATGEADGGTWGLAVLNDGKYSFDVLDNDMRMTVANGSLYADHYAGPHRDGLGEHLDQGVQTFRYALLPHRGGWQQAGVVRAAVELNTEEVHVAETYHPGPLPQVATGITLGKGADGLVVTALKPAADGKGHVLRLYESAGAPAEAHLRLDLLGREFEVKVPAFGLQSYYIPADPGAPVATCDLTEMH